MPKVATKLTAAQVAKLKPRHDTRPTFHPVGGVAGLYLQLTPNGSGSWVLRAKYGGKRRSIGLGAYPELKLGDAYTAARDVKAMIAEGVDPIAKRKADAEALRRAQGMTFAEAVDDYLRAKLSEFRNEKHKKQWRSSLDSYAVPVIGGMAVRDITVHDVQRVLKPIWTTKTETASRLRGRIENVLAYATVQGHREGDNPARWKGNLDTALPKPAKVKTEKHWPAVQVSEAAGWFAALRKREGTAARALEFLTLCASRSGEVRGMTWDEVDLEAGVWTIPAARMKAKKEHRVPLTEDAKAILQAMPRRNDSPYVFAAQRGGMLSDMSVSAVMRRMQSDAEKAGGTGWLDAQSGKPAVPHGLRSTFRDWAAETGIDRDLAEMSLAHKVGSDVERAYRRTDMFERRAEVLIRWGRFNTIGTSKMEPHETIITKM